MSDEENRLPSEADIEELIADTNPNFPLTQVNALAALTPPHGAIIERVAGRGVKGGDIIFRFPDGSRFFREIKCITGGRNAFNRRLSRAASQSDAPAGRGDIFVQVRAGYPVREALDYFLFYRRKKPEELGKYRGVRLQVRDETGAVLYDDVFWEG